MVVKSTTPQDFLTGCVRVAAADTCSVALAVNGEVFTLRVLSALARSAGS
jgi:hypothetical protein